LATGQESAWTNSNALGDDPGALLCVTMLRDDDAVGKRSCVLNPQLDQAASAGMGWGGDRYQVLGDDRGHLALALQTAWDSPNEAQEFFDAYSVFVGARAGSNPAILRDDPTHLRWQLADRQFYLGRAGNQVLVLHAPDGATLDALLNRAATAQKYH
jgi:hypothetical protein